MPLFDEPITVGASPEESGQGEEAADLNEGEENEGQDIEEGAANDEGQEDAGTDGNDDGSDEGSEGSEQPDNDLLDGKFRSPEDLLKAYQNAQRKITEQGQQIRQLQQQTGNQPPAARPQPGQNGAPNELVETFWENFQQDPLGTMQYLIENAVQQRTAPIVEQRQNDILAKNIESVAKEFGKIRTEEGMSQLLTRVGEIAQELGNPNLARNPSPRVLRMAAMELFGDTRAQLYQKAKQKGREEAEATRRAKQGAATPAGARKPTEQPKSEADQIREGIVAAGRAGKLF